jgi:acetolactate synthase-1/2/3 large subunit
MQAARHLVQTLADAGVGHVFGLPGTTVLAPLEALREDGRLRFVTARHEQSAAHMADAAARVTGRLGVALVDIGPGVANTVTAVLAAARDSSPLLLVAGNEERRLIGREVWHELDELGTFGGVAKLALRVPNAASFPRLLRQAATAAVTGRPGPVLLSVPKDVWLEDVDVDNQTDLLVDVPGRRPAAHPEDVVEVVRHLERATKPVVLVGAGALRAAASGCIRGWTERYGLPVITSPNGRGVVAEDSPGCAGVAGRFGNRVASELLAEADVVLVLGCRLSDLTTNQWTLLARTQTIVQVDIEASLIGVEWPVDVGIEADALAFMEQLAAVELSLATDRWRATEVCRPRHALRNRFFAIDDPELVKPQHVLRALQDRVAVKHRMFMGGGKHQQFVGEWVASDPSGFVYAANSGAMGFAFPAAIASAVVDPGTLPLCCLGDGDFMMAVHELETAARERAGVKTVVLNDFGFGAIRERQAHPIGTSYGNPDFARLAETFGLPGRQVSCAEEVEASLEWLLGTDGFALLDVHIDPDERRSLTYGHDIGQEFLARRGDDAGDSL